MRLSEAPPNVQQLAREAVNDYRIALEKEADYHAQYEVVSQKIQRLRGMGIGLRQLKALLDVTNGTIYHMAGH